MRRTPLLVAAVSLVAAATPAALLAHPSDGPKGKAPERHHHHPGKDKAKGPKGALHLVNACVTAGAEEDAETKAVTLDLKVLSANRHMRDALGGGHARGKTFTATIDASTVIRLVGKARVAPEGSTEKKLPRFGSWDSLDTGDVVTVRYRVKRGTAVADLGPAWKVTDRGPFAKKCPVPDPKTETPPASETPGTPAPSL
jgi:hypothetical protein